MSLDISRVRFEPSRGIGRLLYRQQGLLREWGSIGRLSTSDFAGDGTRMRNFRHGEAPGEERELRKVALVAREVELIRKAATPLIFKMPRAPDGSVPFSN